MEFDLLRSKYKSTLLHHLTILTLGGPRITPLHRVRVMSSSSSRPQLTVPSPTPFWPSSSSSRSRKLRGTLTPVCGQTHQCNTITVPSARPQQWAGREPCGLKMRAGGVALSGSNSRTMMRGRRHLAVTGLRRLASAVRHYGAALLTTELMRPWGTIY